VTGRITRLDDPQPNLLFSHKSVLNADADGIAQAGDTLTYTITISNSGELGAGIILTDALPLGLTYVDDSLSIAFPGTGFAATVVDNVLTAHTENSLDPPIGGSLPIGGRATIAFVVQVSDVVPDSDRISNTVELEDQFGVYAIPPAVIPYRSEYRAFLPFVQRP
jgi:uncharacterized repeat protein (TIGR01451 family)